MMAQSGSVQFLKMGNSHALNLLSLCENHLDAFTVLSPKGHSPSVWSISHIKVPSPLF